LVFSSHIFLHYFLPTVLLVYFSLPWVLQIIPKFEKGHITQWQNAWLLVASLVFFGWWSWRYVPLMLCVTGVNYLAGAWIAKPTASQKSRRMALVIAVITSLANLSVFKYFGFFQTNLNGVLANLEFPEFALWEFVLPLGISFYTFQAITYTVDVYRGDAKPAESLTDFFCYIAFFPQLVAGPIIRYQTIADQLKDRRHSTDLFASGVQLFILGLAKKVLLANPWGRVADLAFSANSLNSVDAWFGAVAYAFQLYFDFSGYSDMAVGLARMFGFHFPRNFDAPYRATSITDFWRRWHISLSTFLRDYLYKPLGGNRRGSTRTYANLLVVMVLGGLWHGAGWTFVVWGAYHGLLLAFERSPFGKKSLDACPKVLRILVTLVLVMIGWVVFRAASLPDAIHYLSVMFSFSEPDGYLNFLSAQFYTRGHLLLLAISIFVVAQPRQAYDSSQTISWLKVIASLILLFASLTALAGQAANPFIYFQF
jgi:alginate O-acetyltransferase complex protein AlgI